MSVDLGSVNGSYVQSDLTAFGTQYVDANKVFRSAAPGTAGFVLTSNGPVAAPTYQSVGSIGYYSLTPYIVGPDIHSQFTDIQPAIDQAVSDGHSLANPANILIKAGTYTGTYTVATGINLVSMSPNSVTIKGKIIDGGLDVVCDFVNMKIVTNVDYCLAPTGGSNFNLYSCNVIAFDHAAIHMTNNDNNIYFFQCEGDIQNNSVGYFVVEDGDIWFFGGIYNNTSESTVQSTNAGGIFIAKDATFAFAMATSGTGSFGFGSDTNIVKDCVFETSAINAISITTAGNQPNDFHNCIFSSGTASAISVGAGTRVLLNNPSIDSSEVSGVAVTGAGTAKYGNVLFTGTARIINTTTQEPIPFFVGPTGVIFLASSGDPNGVITAGQGSIYSRTDGSSSSTRMYVNTNSGTAWTNILTSS